MQYQEKMVQQLPCIKLVKQEGKWVSEEGLPVRLFTRVPGVEFTAEGNIILIVTTCPPMRFSRPSYRITVNSNDEIVEIKDFNSLAFKSPGIDPWMDIDECFIPAVHPLANSFYVVKVKED